MKPGRRRLIALLGLIMLIGFAGTIAADTAIYTPDHRVASELLPVIESALGEELSATLDAATNSIVLVGSEQSIASARALLQQLDVIRRSVTIRVESRTERGLRSAGYRIGSVTAAGSLRVGRLVDRDGSMKTWPPASPAARGRAYSSTRDDVFSTSLRILDGETGRIETGRSVPITDWGLFGSTTSIVEVSSGLLATPRVLGNDRVQLQIAPYEGDLDPAARTRVMQTATTLIVRTDEIVVLGSLRRRGSAAGQDAFARRSQSEAIDDRWLLVLVEID